MKKKYEKIAAALVCLVLLAGGLPGTVSAAELWEDEVCTTQDEEGIWENEAGKTRDDGEIKANEDGAANDDDGMWEEAQFMAEAGIGLDDLANSWPNYADSGFEAGDGSIDDPYEISTAEQLAYLAAQVNSGTSYQNEYFIQSADIDLSRYEWVPIGQNIQNSSNSCYFRGRYDGKGYDISGMTITSINNELNGAYTYYTGLFGAVKHSSGDYIRNIKLTDLVIDVVLDEDVQVNIGGLMGTYAGLAGNISGCTVSGEINYSHNGYDRYMAVGGLVGEVNSAYTTNYSNFVVIENCESDVEISAWAEETGGLIGDLSSSTHVRNCGAAGDVTVIGPEGTGWNLYAGGLIGYSFGQQNPLTFTIIENCYATGFVSGYAEETSMFAGGFVGGADYGIRMQSCFAGGDVVISGASESARAYGGGFAGSLTFAGSEVQNCYSAGDVLIKFEPGMNYGYGAGFSANLAAAVEFCYAYGNATSLGAGLENRAYGFAANVREGSTVSSCVALGEKMSGNPVSPFLSTDAAITTANNKWYAEMDFGSQAHESNSSESVPTTLAEVIDRSTFADWNADVWDMDSAKLPVLRNIPASVQGKKTPVYFDEPVTVTFFVTDKIYDGLPNAISNLAFTDKDGNSVVLSSENHTILYTGTETSGLAYESDAAPVNAGSYTVDVTVVNGYRGSLTEDFNIDQRPVTITANNKSVKVGESLPVLDYTIEGAVAGEAENRIITGLPVLTCPSVNLNAAGDYDILIDISGVTTASNYTFSTAAARNGILTITRTSSGGNGGRGSSYYTVTFDSNGGSTVTSQSVLPGKKADEPNAPVRAGFIFTRWYKDAALTIPYNFDTAVTANIILYAGWEETGDPGSEPWDNPFTDVSENDWFYDDVRFVYEKGLMVGTSGAIFSPDFQVTRGMVVAILWRIEGEPQSLNGNPFTDLQQDWYVDAVVWASEHDIVAGYGGGLFGPEDSITREQLAAILYRYAQYKGMETGGRGDLSGYADYDDISGYALEALQWANAQGLITGRSEALLVPRGAATRAETAAILHRFL